MKLIRHTRNQKGFTLVELAIVLVIIGIILGAVLKGQELINNAKIKRLYNQQREIAAALYTYYDRYSYFPGDDPNMTATQRGWTGITSNGNGNGLICAAAASETPNFTCAASGSEQCNLWAALRYTNIIAGSTAPGAAETFRNPSNSYGGAIAVSYFTIAGTPSLTVNWIHFQNIPAEVALILDTQNDDGIYNRGSIRGSSDYTAGTTIARLSFRL